MESCSCVHCTADAYHIEQMQAEEAVSKDDYMESKNPSVYEKLYELRGKLNSTRQVNAVDEIMDAVNAIHNELLVIAMRLDLKSTTVDDILELQERLY